MKTKSIVIALFIGILLPLIVNATEVKLTPDVPKYSQDEFNNNIFYDGVTKDRTQDCVPTSVGMVFGYFYRKFQSSGNYNLIPVLSSPYAPIDPNGDLADWANNQHGIKRLVEYQFPETSPYSLSEFVDYSYGQLGNGYVGTYSGDLSRKIRQAFSAYDANFSLTVSWDEINTAMNNKDEIVARIKSEIDQENPVMFYAKAGLSYIEIASNTSTPTTFSGGSVETLDSTVGIGHAMVVTGYNGNIFRLNFGYDSPAEIIIDAANNFGYPSNQGKCAEVYFFTMGEAAGVGHGANNSWVESGAGASQNFINTYVKFDGVNTIGSVSTQTPYVYSVGSGNDIMYVQKFVDASANETFLISALRNNWYYTFPVTGDKLVHWSNNYASIGHPEGMPENKWNINGVLLNVQKFVTYNGNIVNIGSPVNGGNVSAYTENELFALSPIETFFADAVSSTTLELIFSGIEGAENYEILYRETGTTNYSLAGSTSGTSYLLQNLSADTAYDFLIRAIVGNDTINMTGGSETTFSSGNTFYPVPAANYPAYGNVEFLYGNAYAYGYGPGNGAIYQEDPCPTCPDLWKLHVTYWGPFIGCAETPQGLPLKYMMIEFRAKVENGGNPVSSGYLYARDWSGNSSTEWAHSVSLTPLFDPTTYQDGQFFNYRVSLANVTNPEGMFRQFILGLTTGSYNQDEKWTFDWIHVYTAGVDFVNNYALWYDCNFAGTSGYSDGNRIIVPSGSRPSIVSAGLMPLDSLYTKVGMNFKIENTNQEVVRVFFNTGSGYSAAPYASKVVDHGDGNMQKIVIDIPTVAIGQVRGIAVMFFDNEDYQDKTIYVDDMVFLVDDEDESLLPYPVLSVSEYLNQ